MAMSQVYSGETQSLEKFLTETTSAPGVVSIQQLQDIAQLRLSLTLAAELISDTLSDNNGPDGAEDFLKMVRKLCEESGNDWYRVYLIRKLSERWGAGFIQALVKRPNFRWLIPTEIHQQNEDDAQMDQYLVYGEDFKIVRDAVAKAVIDADVDWIEEVCEKCNESPRKRTIYILLALFREITTLYRSESTGLHCTPELHQAFEDFISGSNYLASREVRDFATALIHNNLGCLSIHPGLSVPENTVIELTVHLAAVLLTSTHPLLMPLNQLGLSPENMQKAFIPTMPDDMLAVAQAAIQQHSQPLSWYECPNKHPCCVDMCGLPTETTKCPECGEEIGGLDHKAVPGFNRILIQGDRTRHGHILGDPAERNKPNTLDTKDMSLTPFILVRLVTHLAMLLGSSEKHQCIKQIIDPPVEDACLFLTKHIQKDIDRLNQALGKGADYCLTAIHMLLRSLLDQPVKTSHTIDPNLATKQSRNTWDTTMVADIMTPQLTILDQFLPQVRDGIRNDSRVSKNLIVMLVSGDECDFLRSLPGVSQIHSSAVWSCRKRLSLLSLTHAVQHTDKKEELPLLLRFLQKEKEFRQIKFLPDILTLQKVLVRQFQNTSDEIVGSIGEFIDKQSGKRAWYKKHINIFLKTWNLLRLPVTNNELKIPEEFCSQDLDINSDLQYLLTQRQGPGLCATGLVSYLVTLHNELVKVMDSYTGEDSSSYKVSVVELSEQHVISYDLEKDLLPLVLSNCQYSLEQGHETISQYDLPRIQQQILIHFIQGKPLITRSGIPTLVNTQDRDYESTFKAIKGKVPQDPMPSLKRTGVSRLLGSYSDVCEALKIVELVLGFLSMTGGDPKMTLGTYLKDVLRITDTDQQILQALNKCTLNHCISLWQLLSFLRSENMLHLNREPFGSAAYSAYQQPLSEEERTELKGFVLRRMVDQWWFELHEFLLLNLGRPRSSDFYNPEWSVKVSMIAHMDRKAVEVPACVEEEFPENMHLSQIVEIWKCAAIARRERMNNGS